MSDLRLLSRLRRLGIGATLVLGVAVFACDDNDEVFGPNGELIDGQRDSGTTTTDSAPRPLPDAAPPIPLPPSNVALGDGFSCVVAKDRAVYCWGRNDFGQLGVDPLKTPSCGAFPCTPTPTKVEGLPRIATVMAGKDFACALDEVDSVWCWGNNGRGQILGATESVRPTPARVAVRAKQIAVGGQHACYLDLDGFVHCWGDNECGIFGRPDAGVVDHTRVAYLPAQAAISLGADQVCTVALDSSVLCWGTDHKGSLGHPLGTTTCNGQPFDPIPKRVAQDGPDIVFKGAAEVHVGLGLVCVRKTDNKVWCWGDNSHGGLGQGVPDTDTHAKPVQVPEIETTTLAVGGETGCAVVAERLLCWGDARFGQLDSGGTTCGGTNCRPLGYVVAGQQPVKALSVGPANIATIKGDGSLSVWGKNDSAEVGVASADATNVSCTGGSKCISAPRTLAIAAGLE